MQSSAHFLPLFIACGVLAACATDTADTTPSHPASTNEASGNSSGGSAVAPSAGNPTGGGGGTSAVTEPPSGTGGMLGSAGSGSNLGGTLGSAGASAQKPLALPFFVNAPGNFVKSGFMGDAATAVTAAPSATDNDGTCSGARAGMMAGGDCDTFKLTPAAMGTGWQGVFYQFPSGNWGKLPGRNVAAGAKSVSFWAKSSRDVAVEFQVGMCDPEHPKDASTCADGFFAFPGDADDAHKLKVTSEWTKHSVSLAKVDYSGGIRGAFSWVIVNDDLLGNLDALTLYLDAMTWE
jgi:hypothetical protein